MTVVQWPAVTGFEQLAFGRIFEKVERPAAPEAPMVTAYTDGDVTLRSGRNKIGYHEAANMDGYQGVEPGDFVVHGLDILRGSVGISDSSGAITKVCSICQPIKQVDLRFVAHAIRTQARSGFIRAMARGIRDGGADFRRWGTLAELPIPYPPLEEQQAIADYLDRETQQIDELIAEQRGLIEILRERRSAVIDAVSLGDMDPLDSQAVGRWPVGAIGRGFDVMLGKMLDASKKRDQNSSYLPYIRAGNIQDEGLRLSAVNEMPFTPQEAKKFSLERDDLLVVEGGAIGTCVVLDADMPGWAFQKTVNRLRSTTGWSSRYYRYVITAYRDRGVLDILSNKSTIAHFTAEKLRGLRVPVPPIEEQHEISAYLDDQTSRIDALITESEDLISLSQERRAALITAAVTGQIDLRTAA